MSWAFRQRLKRWKNDTLSRAGFKDDDFAKGKARQFPEIPGEFDRDQYFHRQIYGGMLRYDVEDEDEDEPKLGIGPPMLLVDGQDSNVVESRLMPAEWPKLGSVYLAQPISSKEIRLVTIAPASRFDDTLQCWLTHCWREESPGYAAVSYTWGDISQTGTITVNDQDVQVSQSCADALRTVRDAEEPRTVWIDALCINQQDLQERASQVAQMGDVFRLAQHTFAYLGASTNNYEIHSPESTWQELFKRPWFSRTWVIQEVLLSKNITFLLGLQRIPLLHVLEFCSSLGVRIPKLLSIRQDFVHDYAMRPPKSWNDGISEDGDDDVLAALDNKPLPYLSSQDQHASTSRSVPIDSKGIDPVRQSGERDMDLASDASKASGNLNLNYWRLPELLNNTRDFGCIDARDKLFAILPLFTQPIPALLYPDYERPVLEVYKDIAWCFLRQELSDALVTANGLDTLGLPSWATDWTKPRLRNSPLIEPVGEEWRAGFPSSKREPRVVRRDERLVIRGFRIGYMDSWRRSRGYRFLAGGREAATLNVEIKHNSIPNSSLVWVLNSRSEDPENLTITTIAKALEGLHQELWGRSLVNETPDPVHLAKDRSQPVRSERKLTLRAGKLAWKVAIEYLDSWKSTIDADDAFSAVRIQKSDGYSFGYTEDHDFAAFSKTVGSTRTGFCDPARQWDIKDEICVLLGYNTPFLLRRSGEGYKMIGQCRVLDKSVMCGGYVDQVEWSQVWSEPCPAPLQDYLID